jgi:AraC-like DNA-binding protein
VVFGQPIGPSQLELQSANWGGEHIVPDGFSRSIRPSAAVADFVEAIWDWDIPDGDAATGLTIKIPPSTAPYFVVQYRTLTHCRWQLGADSHDHKNYGHVLTQTQSGTFAVRPRGPLRVITIRLKPEGAARSARASMHELINVKIGLRNIFRDHDIALLEERVMESGSSSERIARVESFLLQNFREDREESVFSRASSSLRRNPGLRMRKLASLLDISERHLTRGFRATFGTSPKEYARLARIEKVIVARKSGLGWAEVAYACGFTDQAHLIHDFGTIVGGTPAEFFGAARQWSFRGADAGAKLGRFLQSIYRLDWYYEYISVNRSAAGRSQALHGGAARCSTVPLRDCLAVTEFLHRWFQDGRVADQSKNEKHHRSGRTTIEHPESLQEIACVKQFDLVQGYSY